MGRSYQQHLQSCGCARTDRLSNPSSAFFERCFVRATWTRYRSWICRDLNCLPIHMATVLEGVIRNIDQSIKRRRERHGAASGASGMRDKLVNRAEAWTTGRRTPYQCCQKDSRRREVEKCIRSRVTKCTASRKGLSSCDWFDACIAWQKQPTPRVTVRRV